MGKWSISLKKIRKIKKETWILLLLAGIMLFVIALPVEKKEGQQETDPLTEDSGERDASGSEDYVKELEKRVEMLLSEIDGAGETMVLLTVESAGETILQTDRSFEQRSVRETDSEGGVGNTEEVVQSGQTVLFGSEEAPYVTKILCPKVTGVVVAAEGGDDARIKAEISEAMEALFGVPPHKIKVLKRVKKES